MTAIVFSPAIGPVPLDIFISENHESELAVTEVPVEAGADITDHAYRRPSRVRLSIGAEQAVLTWQALKAFQETRIPFSIVTGLDVYQNMLITRMSAPRDAQFSNVLRSEVELQEVIIVETSASGGAPGGLNSNRAAAPAPLRSGDTATRLRASSKATRGDNRLVTVPSTASNSVSAPSPIGGTESGDEILKQAFGF